MALPLVRSGAAAKMGRVGLKLRDWSPEPCRHELVRQPKAAEPDHINRSTIRASGERDRPWRLESLEVASMARCL